MAGLQALSRTDPPRAVVSGEWVDDLVIPDVNLLATVDETADGSHVHWIEPADPAGKDGSLVRFAWDGRVGEPFELIPQQSGERLVRSPDDRRVAYFGRRGGRFFVGVDGEERPAFDGITRSVPPTFSGDGSRLAYGVMVDRRFRLMVDGQLYGDWDPAPIPPVFSPDGSRLAFVAESGSLTKNQRPKDYRQWVVLDGVDQPKFDLISAEAGSLRFSPDGGRLAYWCRDGGGLRLVLDGSAHPPVAGAASPVFMPDGSRLVWFEQGPRGLVLTGEDGLWGGEGAFQATSPMWFSPDGRRSAFFGVRAKGRMVVVVDGVESAEYADGWGTADPVAFSADSRRTAALVQHKSTGFMGTKKGSWALLLDGDETGSWDEVSSTPHFSPDCRHVALSARIGKGWCTVVDGVPGPAFDRVSPPVYGPDGRLAYLGTLGRQGPYRLMVDGSPGIEMGDILEVTRSGAVVAFSPDGAHVVAIGEIGGAFRPVVDRQAGPGFFAVGKPRFVDGRVVFLGLSPEGIHRVSPAV